MIIRKVTEGSKEEYFYDIRPDQWREDRAWLRQVAKADAENHSKGIFEPNSILYFDDSDNGDVALTVIERIPRTETGDTLGLICERCAGSTTAQNELGDDIACPCMSGWKTLPHGRYVTEDENDAKVLICRNDFYHIINNDTSEKK